jgi:hypothetical protein
VTAAVLQPEFALDDPRNESKSVGIVAELREFVQASRDMRGLLTVGQASKILNVTGQSINVWIRRGRLQCREVVGVRMVSAAEILALYRQLNSEDKQAGGRGIKAPSLRVLAEEAWRDIDPSAG